MPKFTPDDISIKDINFCATSVPYRVGDLSVVVRLEDFKIIMQQMWKSRNSEPKIGELYEKYKGVTYLEDK